MVFNVHEREISAKLAVVGTLIDSLSSADDRLWPYTQWPAMRMDRELGVGARGGHGPVRYFVTAYEPGRRVEFQFTGPAGFHGCHSFAAIGLSETKTLLRHELELAPTGAALMTWPLFFRPLHDALIEESLDRAQHECGAVNHCASKRSPWVKILRASFPTRLRQARPHSR